MVKITKGELGHCLVDRHKPGTLEWIREMKIIINDIHSQAEVLLRKRSVSKLSDLEIGRLESLQEQRSRYIEKLKKHW